ncbi:MAG: hypothetical protein AAGA92_12440 [Planctomycetota bacterium]
MDTRLHRRAERPPASAGRGKVWVLLGALALVSAAISRTRQPEFAEQLERVFTPQQETPNAEPLGSEPAGSLSILAGADPEEPEPFDPAREQLGPLDAIQDNTYFRPAEQPAWFAMLGRVRDTAEETLAASAVEGVGYAQLIQQPDVYRGRAIALRGTVVREEQTGAAANDAGINGYHRLWIAPRGGGKWPLVAYCLELPEAFPRGDGLREPVELTGLFFKNWSYAFEESDGANGLGLAPVVLAKNVSWAPQPVEPAGRETVGEASGVTVLLTAAAAGLVTAWAWRRTRRPDRGAPAVAVDWEGVDLSEGGAEARLANLAASEDAE